MTRPLNILIATAGSHGDLHPFIKTASVLRSRGHEVRILAPAIYEDLVKSLGIDFVPIGTVEQFDRIADDPNLWRPMRAYKVVARAAGEFIQPVYQAVADRCEPGRTMLVMSSLVLGARVAQEKLKIPGVSIHLSPTAMRSAIAPARTALPVRAWMPAWTNRIAYAAADRLMIDPPVAGKLNQFRSSLGMAPVRGIFANWFHSPDRVVCLFPRWFAPPQSDWPPNSVLTGFPMYDEADVTTIDPALEGFLDEGAPPIAFTPGSGMRHAQAFFAAAMDACDRLKTRGLFLTRHAGNVPRELPSTFHHAPFAPFSRLLPRCAAIVHHGGIGTSAQGLAAGIPQLVMPMAHDQFDNADRLRRLGVAEFVPARRFSGRLAAAKLRHLLHSADVAKACAAVKTLMQNDNPFDKTALAIEEVV